MAANIYQVKNIEKFVQLIKNKTEDLLVVYITNKKFKYKKSKKIIYNDSLSLNNKNILFIYIDYDDIKDSIDEKDNVIKEKNLPCYILYYGGYILKAFNNLDATSIKPIIMLAYEEIEKYKNNNNENNIDTKDINSEVKES